MSVAFPLVTGYHVEPVKAAWSAWAPSEFPYNYISQTVTCNFDEVVYFELFVGDYNDSGAFKVDVYEVGGEVDPVAYNYGVPPAGEHRWLRLDLTTASGYSFTKGKQYEFKFTRSDGDLLA
jgi:hypothetical protein